MAQEDSAALEKKLGALRRAGEEREAERIAAATGHPYVDLRKTPVSLEAIKLIPEADAKAAQAAAIEFKTREVALAAHDPASAAVQNIVKSLEAKGYRVTIFIVSLSSLAQAWLLYKFVSAGSKGITGKVEIEKERVEDLLRRLTTLSSVGEEVGKLDFQKLVTAALFEIVLAGALANRASDIHFEAEEKKAKIRYRIDGILHAIFDNLPPHTYRAVVSRIKLLSGLKINIESEAQDGRFTIALTTKEIEMRVSTIPSEFGETVVMRILDPDSINISLEQLGIREDDLTIVERELSKPNGLILNTGPTGSGKTTTLYAFLRYVNSPDIKIITIEDPIEYHLPGVEQTQVDPKAGYTFASGLRSILRQDPDVILVGEVRDLETADIALQAALTGHIVFSTLHTNDAVGAVPRLIDLGVKVISIGPSLGLVIAQRLVRRLCAKCKKPAAPTADLKKKTETFLSRLPRRVNRGKYENITLFSPGGCAICNTTGYRGRIGIFEFLEGGPDLERIVLKEPSEVALRELAKKQEMVSLQEDGVLKAFLGETTFEEVQNVTGPITW